MNTDDKKLKRMVKALNVKPMAAPKPKIQIIVYENDKITFYFERMDDSEENKKRIEVTFPVMELTDRIVNLIPPKGFKMIRHFGLYSRNKKRKMKEIMNNLKLHSKRKEKKLNNILKKLWEKRCLNCGAIMIIEEQNYPFG